MLQLLKQDIVRSPVSQKVISIATLQLTYSLAVPPFFATFSTCQHNKHVLSNANTPTPQPDTCNCRKKSDCPLEGKCLQTDVIYQATVSTETATETYVGLATNFKERYRNHETSFRHSKRRNETQLSKYVWNLQNEKKPFQIKWKILKKCKPYSNVSKKCSLCLNEKFIIICKKRTV